CLFSLMLSFSCTMRSPHLLYSLSFPTRRSSDLFTALDYSGVDFHQEFHGFETVEESIAQSVDIIRNHPLLPSHILVHGLVISPETGKADVVSLDKREVEK